MASRPPFTQIGKIHPLEIARGPEIFMTSDTKLVEMFIDQFNLMNNYAEQENDKTS